MSEKTIKLVSLLTYLLLVFLVTVSICGAFVPSTYKLETESLAAQGVGQDLVDLFLVSPILLISLIYSRRGNIKAMLIFSRAVFYVIYSFVIYSLGIHFNYLFLAYCAVLGISVYLFIIMMSVLRTVDPGSIKEGRIPYKSTAVFLFAVSVIFYMLWLKDIVPAIIGGYTPASVTDYNLLVNPVHVIDLAFALPGLIIAGILLLKKKDLGYILTPIALIFMILMAIALAAMVLLTEIRGISEDPSIAVIFVVLTIISLFFLVMFFRKTKT